MPAAVPRDPDPTSKAPVSEPDSILVRRALGGDHTAFAEVYHRHVGRVYAVCLRLVRDRARAEDLTQDAFVRCWERLGQYRGDSAFGTWLYRLAVNVVFEAGRKDRRRQLRVEVTSDLALVEPVEEAPARTAGLRLDLEQAIAALPDRAREVFVLFDVEGYSHEEIADLTGIAVGTSKAQLFRARRLLREQLRS